MPVKRTTLVASVVNELINLIESRGYGPGDKLPSTAELSELLDVSRTVVREAIAELAGQGVLLRSQGRDTEITFPDSEQFERLVRLRFILSGAQFEAIQEFREMVEVGSARLAAQRATLSDLEILESSLKEIENSADIETLHEKDQAFHREIARASGNDFISFSLDGITPLLIELRKRAWSGWLEAGRGMEEINSAHRLIFEAIKAGDSAAAASAMSDHLAQARFGLIDVPAQRQPKA